MNEFEAVRQVISELRAEIAAIRTENTVTRDALLASMVPLRENIEKFIAAELHRVSLGLELEFGSALSLQSGSGARKQEADEMIRASLQSFERRLSRGAEHIARIESRLQRLEQ